VAQEMAKRFQPCIFGMSSLYLKLRLSNTRVEEEMKNAGETGYFWPDDGFADIEYL